MDYGETRRVCVWMRIRREQDIACRVIRVRIMFERVYSLLGAIDGEGSMWRFRFEGSGEYEVWGDVVPGDAASLLG